MAHLNKDKERLLIVNDELKRNLPRGTNYLDMEDQELDGSFLDLK